MKKLLFVFLFFLILISCNKKKEDGFKLLNYKVLNTQLDSLNTNYVSFVKAIEDKHSTDYIPFILLNYYDSLPCFSYKVLYANYFSPQIFYSNYKILGYLEYQNHDIILMADNNIDVFDLTGTFYQFIYPTEDITKGFENIYFPTFLYSANSDSLIDIRFSWNDFIFTSYIYKDNHFIKLEYE